jgi:hypothetical protein
MKSNTKKEHSGSQNMLKCTLKNIAKHSDTYKERKDSSTKKRKTSKKN